MKKFKRIFNTEFDSEYLDDVDIDELIIKGKYPDEKKNVWDLNHTDDLDD